MTDPTIRLPSDRTPLVLATWVILQLLALTAAAARWPFTARFPQPAEQWSAHEMVVVQMAAGALLLPVLMRGSRRSTFVIATAWPMLKLAAMLARTPAPAFFAAGAVVSAWLVTLAFGQAALKSERAQVRAVACAVVLILFAPVLAYLRIEYGGAGWPIENLSPLSFAMLQLNAPHFSPPAAALLCVMLLTAICAAISRHKKRHRLE